MHSTQPSRTRKISLEQLSRVFSAPTTTQGQSSQRPRHTRKISVEQISRPRPHPEYDVRLWVAEGQRSQNAPPPRPPRPATKDLPYGEKGSVPIRRVEPRETAQEASGSTRRRALAAGNMVPFPSAAPKADRAHAPRETTRRPRTSESAAQGRSPPGPSGAIFSPFAPVSRDDPRLMARKTEESRAKSHRGASRAVQSPQVDQRSRETKGKSRAREEEDAYCAPGEPATVRRQGAIRRTSKTSDAQLPPQHLRDRFGGSESNLIRGTPQRVTDLQRSNSHSVASRPALSPASSSLFTSTSKPRPQPRDVPRDVDPRQVRSSRLDSSDSDRSEYSQASALTSTISPAAPVVTRRAVEEARAGAHMRNAQVPQGVQIVSAQEVQGPHRVASCKGETGEVYRGPGTSRPVHAREQEQRRQARPGKDDARQQEERREARRGRTVQATTEYYVLSPTGSVTPLPTAPAVPAAETRPLNVRKKARGEKEGMAR